MSAVPLNFLSMGESFPSRTIIRAARITGAVPVSDYGSAAFAAALGSPFARAFVSQSHRPRLSVPLFTGYSSSSSVFLLALLYHNARRLSRGKMKFFQFFAPLPYGGKYIPSPPACYAILRSYLAFLLIMPRIARKAELNPPTSSISPHLTASLPSITEPMSFAMRSERIIIS